MPTGGGGGGGVSGWPLTWFAYSAVIANQNAGTNQVSVSGFALPAALTFAHIAINVGTADAVNNYDIGIYTQAGALVADIGAQTLPSTGLRSFVTVQGAKTIPPGLYLFGWTGNAATAAISEHGFASSWLVNANVAASAGGALPASIGAQVVTPATFAWYFHLY